MNLAQIFADFSHALRGCRMRALGCFILVLLLLAGLCGFLFWGVGRILADSPSDAQPLSVYLLIDNSQSMFDLNGTGSDPDMLRIDAARLFISYLGIDDSDLDHECGVIFFGGRADVVVPLTRLSEDGRRAQMLELIQNPAHIEWTDHVQALQLAMDQLPQRASGQRPAFVLLTDGKPELEDGSEKNDEAYLAELRRISEQMAAQDVPLFIILLANEATDADADIAGLWKPLWQEMALATPPGRFYEARQASDLLAIYHDIVVALAGSRTAGPIIQGDVGPAGVRQTVPVEENLQRLTLVVSKSKPDLSVAVLLPDGTPLSEKQSGVRHAGQAGLTPEEIWTIDTPTAGDWTILISGEGQVIVWKDYRPAPPPPTLTPVPTMTPQPTLTPEPTMTPVPTDTPTPTPTMQPEPSATAVPAPVIQVKEPPQEAAAVPADAQSPSPTRMWPAVILCLGAILTLVVFRRQRRHRPFVSGSLRHLSGPGFLDAGQVQELDTLRRAVVTVGPAPANVPLAGADGSFTIRLGQPINGDYEMIIQGSEEILVNDRPLEKETALEDAAIITSGSTKLQYENLRLRQAQRRRREDLTQLNGWLSS